MKIVLDTSIRPSCYSYTTRTVCHENRAGHKYPSIVLLLHDTHSVCHENRAGHKNPSIVLLLHDTHSVCHENRAGHKYPSIVLLLHDTKCVMKIVLDTSIRPSCYC